MIINNIFNCVKMYYLVLCSTKIDNFGEENISQANKNTYMKSPTVINSKKKLTGKRPLRKGWTTLENTREINLSDVKRILVYIPNTGKTKQVVVNWK